MGNRCNAWGAYQNQGIIRHSLWRNTSLASVLLVLSPLQNKWVRLIGYPIPGPNQSTEAHKSQLCCPHRNCGIGFPEAQFSSSVYTLMSRLEDESGIVFPAHQYHKSIKNSTHTSQQIVRRLESKRHCDRRHLTPPIQKAQQRSNHVHPQHLIGP